MEKTIVLILVGKRRETSVELQKVLTKWGCNIKTRLGVHDGVGAACTENGFIMLEVVATPEEKAEIEKDLSELKDISAKLVSLSL